MAYRLAGLLRYAAIQFVVLTALAMLLYAGGTWFDPTTAHYQFTGNFLSDLGMTHAFSGRANYASSALFCVALATVGGALVAFVWTWKEFAFERGRAAIAGYAAAVLGTLSGLAFTGVAFTGQKMIAYASMLHIIYLATTIRRAASYGAIKR